MFQNHEVGSFGVKVVVLTGHSSTISVEMVCPVTEFVAEG